jgi:hypothetical protein
LDLTSAWRRLPAPATSRLPSSNRRLVIVERDRLALDVPFERIRRVQFDRDEGVSDGSILLFRDRQHLRLVLGVFRDDHERRWTIPLDVA